MIRPFGTLIDFMLPGLARGSLYVTPLATLALFLTVTETVNAQNTNCYIVVDGTHKKILLENDADKRRPIASLTKVATVLVTLDWIDATQGSESAMMIVPSSAGVMGGANPLGMQPGDQITVRDALYGAMLASDNVSAQTLADFIGWQMIRKTGGKDPIKVFVDQMNALAVTLGMDRTKFVNPHGLDHAGPVGLSTARDMGRLALYGLDNTQLNFICQQTERNVSYIRGGKALAFKIKNTNTLLGQHGVDGMKTGRTRKAGDCLITTARKKDRFIPIDEKRKRRIAYRLVTVTMNSPDRFGQSIQLINQGWAAYEAWIAGGMVVKSRSEMLTNTE